MLHQAFGVCLFVLCIHSAVADVKVRVNDITTKGKTFRVVCTVQGETFVGWFKKDGSKVTSTNTWDKFYVSTENLDHTLVVKDVVVPDGGTYQCRGSDSIKNFTLYVEFYVTDAPENQQFNASETANIKCAAVGFTPPVFRWFKNQEEVLHEKDPRITIMKNGTLQIRKINESDSGSYVCRITQLSFLARTREEERKIEVVVFAPPRINLEKSYTVVYTYAGNPKKTRIKCTFWGYPLPDIKLLKGKTRLKSVKSSSLIKGTIKEGVSPFGNYTCRARNNLGTDKHTVVVREAGPPTPPTNITTKAECGCLTVSWEPPVDTGGFPISLYIQELSYGGTVVTAANVGSSPRTYTFTRHLKPNTLYNISVAGRTVAKIGESAGVVVKTSPCPPSGDIFILNKVTTLNSTNVTVKWTRPPDSGGDEDITYILEYSRADEDGAYIHWNSRRGIKHQELNVAGLVGGSTYLFQVVAVNAAGRSKQSAQKLFYFRPGTFLPTTVPTSGLIGPVDPNLVYDMDVNCTSQLIQVVFALKHFPGLDFRSFRLIGPTCKPDNVTETRIIISTQLDGCNTTRLHKDDVVIYSNKVVARVGDSRSSFYIVEFPFSCSFKKEQLVGVPSFQARRKISTFEAGVGDLSFVMKLFPTSEYKTPYSVVDYPIQVDPRHVLYCQVELMSTDSSLVTFVDSCVATPSMDPADNINYPFIEQGCSVDETVKYIHHPSRAVQRFTILPFKFKDASQPKVYLHCKVLVCHANNKASRCSRGCVEGSMRKRKEIEGHSGAHHDVTFGPVVLAKQTDDQSASPQDSDVSQPSVLLIVFIILGVVTLVACVYGAHHAVKSSAPGVHARVPTDL